MDTKRLRRLSNTVSEGRPEPDHYLTDERKLYRVIVLRVFDDEMLVELEDCATLDVWLVRADELTSMRRVGAPQEVVTRADSFGSALLGPW
jgi:hypothetical protein